MSNTTNNTAVTTFNPQSVLSPESVKTITCKNDGIVALCSLNVLDERSYKMRALYTAKLAKVLPEGEKIEDVIKTNFGVGYSSTRNMIKVANTLLLDTAYSVFAETDENGKYTGKDFNYKQLTALIPRAGKVENGGYTFTVATAKEWIDRGVIDYDTPYETINKLVKEYLNPSLDADVEVTEETNETETATEPKPERLTKLLETITEKWDNLSEAQKDGLEKLVAQF